MTMCKITNVQPSLLLHPLDFLGKEDEADLGFFPAMGMAAEDKVSFSAEILQRVQKPVPGCDHDGAMRWRVVASSGHWSAGPLSHQLRKKQQ